MFTTSLVRCSIVARTGVPANFGVPSASLSADATILNAAGIAANRALALGAAGGLATSTKAMAAPKFKKAPDAPKRFKSAFIIFSAQKHKEIKEDLAKQGRAEKVRLPLCSSGLC